MASARSSAQRPILCDQRVVERRDAPVVLILDQHGREQGAVFASERARRRPERAFHMGEQNTWRDGAHACDLELDGTSLVDRIENALVAFRDGVTGPKVLTAD